MRRAFILAAVLLAMGFPALAQSGCKDTAGSLKAPVPQEGLLNIETPSGPFHFRLAYRMAQCRNGPNQWRGVIDGAGRVLVPPVYSHVIILSATRAVVTPKVPVGQPHSWRYYDLGKGEAGPAAGFTDAGYLRNHPIPRGGYANGETVIPFTAVMNSSVQVGNDWWLNYDYQVYFGGTGEARVYKGVGGPRSLVGEPIEWRGDIFIAQLPFENRVMVSRILDRKGDVLSPAIGRIVPVTTLRTTADSGNKNDPAQALGVDLISLISTEAHPDLPYPELWTPVGPDGGPKPLPAGVIGVFPLYSEVMARSAQAVWSMQRYTQGWAAVSLKKGGGFDIVYGLGALGDILARVGKEPPVLGLRRIHEVEDGGGSTDALLVKSATDGRWRPMDTRFLKISDLPLARDGAETPEAAYSLYLAARRAFFAQRSADYAASVAEGKRLHYIRTDPVYKQLVAEGKLCQQRLKVMALHNDAIAHMLRECGVSDGYILEEAKAKGVDPAAIRFAYDRRDEAIERAEAERVASTRDAAEEAFRNARPSANAWQQRVLAGIEASHDTFMSQSRATYYNNLQQWNRGAQNWGGPN